MRTHFKKNGKKILSLLIAFSFAFGLFNMVACSDSNTTDDNNNGGNTVVQCTHTPCEICGKCTKATCDGEEKCKGHESAPEKKSVSNYFEGVKTTTLKSNITAESGAKSFNELLDRQIDVFAQDILNRLDYVYGNVREDDKNYGKKYDLTNILDNDNNYVLDGNKAVTDTNRLLANVNNFDPTTDKVRSISLNNTEDYQKTLMVSIESDNYFIYSAYFNFTSAIFGGNMTLDDSNLDSNANINKAWIIQNLSTAKETLKLEIAKIISADNTSSTYQEKLSKIDELGFKSSYKNDIVSFINNSIIGSSLVSKDNEYYRYFSGEQVLNNRVQLSGENLGVLNKTVRNIINDEDVYDTNSICTDSPRLYKGYKVVVPAIVEQAMKNTFENTSTSIYPQVSRYAVAFSSNIGTLSQANYKDVVLAPKANTPATKLEFTVKSNSSTDTLTMSVERSGATPITKQVVLSSEGQTFTIDINAMGGAKLGAYNGNKAELNNLNMFAGISEYNADGSYKDSDGDNYIKISFTNPNGAEFSISFDGYFDKV